MTTTEAAYRREKERADRAEEVNREWQDKWLDEGLTLPIETSKLTIKVSGEARPFAPIRLTDWLYCEAGRRYTVEIKSENDKVVFITEERDEFGDKYKVERAYSLESAMRLHREIGEAMFRVRNYLVREKIRQVDEAKENAGKSTLHFP